MLDPPKIRLLYRTRRALRPLRRVVVSFATVLKYPPGSAPGLYQVALLGEKAELMRHHSFTRSVPASRVAGA